MLAAVLLVGYACQLAVGRGERAAETISKRVFEDIGLGALLPRGGSEREARGRWYEDRSVLRGQLVAYARFQDGDSFEPFSITAQEVLCNGTCLVDISVGFQGFEKAAVEGIRDAGLLGGEQWTCLRGRRPVDGRGLHDALAELGRRGSDGLRVAEIYVLLDFGAHPAV